MGLDMYLYRTKALSKNEQETIKDLLGESETEQVFLKSEVAYWRNARPIDEFFNPYADRHSIEVSIDALQDLRNRCERILAELKLEPATDSNGEKYMAIANPVLCDKYLLCTWRIADGESYKNMLESTIKQLDPILKDVSNYSSDVWFNYESDY